MPEVTKRFAWNAQNNQLLKDERNLSFEEVVYHIAHIEHPGKEKYARQKILIVRMRDYAWLVPFVETDEELFLKTIIPSRKATAKYLGKGHDS